MSPDVLGQFLKVRGASVTMALGEEGNGLWMPLGFMMTEVTGTSMNVVLKFPLVTTHAVPVLKALHSDLQWCGAKPDDKMMSMISKLESFIASRPPAPGSLGVTHHGSRV